MYTLSFSKLKTATTTTTTATQTLTKKEITSVWLRCKNCAAILFQGEYFYIDKKIYGQYIYLYIYICI